MTLSSREALGLHHPVHRSVFHGDDCNMTHSLLGHSEQRERQKKSGSQGVVQVIVYCLPLMSYTTH